MTPRLAPFRIILYCVRKYSYSSDMNPVATLFSTQTLYTNQLRITEES